MRFAARFTGRDEMAELLGKDKDDDHDQESFPRERLAAQMDSWSSEDLCIVSIFQNCSEIA